MDFAGRIENALNDIQKIQKMFKSMYGEESIPDQEIGEVLKMAKKEHEELQQYQFIKNATIGEIAEVLKEFLEIGTVEECREAVEKLFKR